ncbi:hypothetical protein EsH8_X_000422 [Colletotrichum jinshuiense]
MLYLTPAQLVTYLKIFYICNGTLPVSTCFIKMAILLQYLRIFEKGSKSRTLTHILLVVNVMWGIAYTFLAWVPCIPVAAYWDWTIPDRGRWAYGTQTAEVLIRTYESHATSNMILDFVIFAIPLPLYFNNKANRKSRKGVLGLFILGSVVLMLSTWRLVSLIGSRAGTYPTLDVTWYAPVPMALAILEIEVAAICASLPVFWPMLQKGMGQIFVTHEVKVTVTTETVETRCDDDDCHETPGNSFSYNQPSDTVGLMEPETFGSYMQGRTTSGAEVPKEPEIFGAYMKGKTTYVTQEKMPMASL